MSIPKADAITQDFLAQLEAREAEMNRASELAEKKRGEIMELERSIQERLRQGGTTGDPLGDLIWKLHGYKPALEADLRRLQARLAGKKGELVLLTYRTQELVRFSTEKEYTTTTWVRLGVLEGEALVEAQCQRVFQRPSISLPVSKYVFGEKREDFARSGGWQLANENIFKQRFIEAHPPALEYYLEYGRRIMSSTPRLTPEDEPGELLVGDREVLAWLEDHGLREQLRPAAVLLGWPLVEAG